MTEKTLSAEARKLVAEALSMLPAGPWEVWSSNSFRRITGVDGRDGGVLSGTVHRSDGHPDLSMPEAQLWALCRVVNAMPDLLADHSRLERENERLREVVRLAGRALDVADKIIERAEGLDTPQEWHDAFGWVAAANSKLAALQQGAPDNG